MLTVDLNERQQAPQVVLDNKELKVPVEKTKLFKLQKQIKGHYELGVSVYRHDNIEMFTQPFLFMHEGKFVTNYKLDIDKGTKTIPINLYFNPMSIKDLNSVMLDEDKTFDLKYKLSLTDKSDSANPLSYDLCTDEKVSVKFKAFKSLPRFSVDWNDEYSKRELVYSESADVLNLGKLKISHNSKLKCAPSIKDISLALDTLRADRPAGKLFDLSAARVNELKSGESTEFDLLWHQANSVNPISSWMQENNAVSLQQGQNYSCKYQIKIDCNVGKDGLKPEIIDGITLRADTLVTRAVCFLSLPTSLGYENHDISIFGNAIDSKEVIEISRNNVNAAGINIEQRIFLDFLNQAMTVDPRCPDACVRVWNIESKYTLSPEDKERLVLRNGMKLEEVFRLVDVESGEIVKSGQSWNLGARQGKRFQILLSPKDILDIIPSATSSTIDINYSLSYNMIADLEGEYADHLPSNDNGAYHFKVGLHFKLRMKPRTEWLSIDFGTSAVVAHYGDENIELKNIKDRFLRKAYPNQGEKWENNDETDKNMIASTVCFNRNNELPYNKIDGEMEDFPKLPLWFSPSQGMMDFPYQLPCLKLLMGYQTLPKLFSVQEQNDFLYYCNAGDKEKTKLYVGEQPTTLVHINTIFREVYRQLFRYYICSENNHVYNRLVLSVPNTYSPVHIDELKQIAREVFPTIYPEHLTIVSESDAVAYYYIANRSDFYRNIPENDSERVLIYDMGAGTLDLTYLALSKEKDDTVVDIISKIGIPKAGNYLDYVLAEIFCDLYKEKIYKQDLNKYRLKNTELQNLINLDKKAVAGTVSVPKRANFRNYFRNVLKPLIAKGDDSKECPDCMDYKAEGVKFTVADYTGNEKFKAYIKDVTDKVLDNLVQTAGDKGFNVDTIIFSGRSSSLKQVRKAVQAKIEMLRQNPSAEYKAVKYADITGKTLSDSPIQQEGSVSALKDVVTEGSLEFASTFNRPNSGYILQPKPYYASFGLIVMNNRNELEWCPLLQPDNIPENVNGIYHAEIILQNVAKLRYVDFVQTYSADPVMEYKSSEKDAMTVLLHFPLAQNGDLRIALDYAPDSSKQFTLMIGANEIKLNPYQDFSNVALRRSLWPVIFY